MMSEDTCLLSDSKEETSASALCHGHFEQLIPQFTMTCQRNHHIELNTVTGFTQNRS
ncbi:hypothetical protein [Chitinophaga sp. Ak27]|uniref:hypothetical protein n=1 Tax=Chitinophaga sp. Ak27 TaxID=2726116 RepID=UPI00145DF802|nr:hypothetical protein [Chitinophaga sp. Ak27]NLU90670.1 hypothetical protein [Chitinophaga sp. Ak27]